MREIFPTRLELVVHPRKPFFGFSRKGTNGVWHVNVRAPPRQNKANAEIEKECTRLFGAQTKIIMGHSSSKKVLEVALAAEILEQKILENVDSEKK